MYDSEMGMRSLELRVLTYNVEGIPWPIRTSDRAGALRRIGDRLGEMREAGEAPHIVLLQEAFISAVDDLIARAGYANFVRGPTASDAPAATSPYIPAALTERKHFRGESLGKWINSGLYILSDFPILEKVAQPFSRAACAGWDCMANKGVLYADIAVPGLPVPLQVFTTHLNSRGDTGVSLKRSLLAHNAQADELHALVSRRADPAFPTIFAGDFNTKGAPERFNHFARDGRFPIVRQICAVERRCPISLPLEGKRPWLGAQDLQGFFQRKDLEIHPVEAEIVFEAGKGPDRLSDHDAYMVTYELRWQEKPLRSVRGPVAVEPSLSSLSAQ